MSANDFYKFENDYLKVIGLSEKRHITKSGKPLKKWIVLCKTCGKEKKMLKDCIIRNKTCGCRNNKIGMPKHSHYLYSTFCKMISRCENKNDKFYKNYGGRGISVCDKWRNSFESFLKDMGERPEGCSIDRINNNGNYEPSNCRWVIQKEQCRNRTSNKLITINGKEMCLSAACELHNLPYKLTHQKIHRDKKQFLELIK